jgi:hypothetical protein
MKQCRGTLSLRKIPVRIAGAASAFLDYGSSIDQQAAILVDLLLIAAWSKYGLGELQLSSARAILY